MKASVIAAKAEAGIAAVDALHGRAGQLGADAARRAAAAHAARIRLERASEAQADKVVNF